MASVWHRQRVAPECSAPNHGRLVIAGIRKRKVPHLIDLVALVAADQVECGHLRLVVDPVWLMHLTCAPQLDITITGVAEAVELERKPIGVDPLDDLILQRAIAAIGQIGGVLACQPLRIVPAEDLGQPPAALRLDRRIMDDHEDARAQRCTGVWLRRLGRERIAQQLPPSAQKTVEHWRSFPGDAIARQYTTLLLFSAFYMHYRRATIAFACVRSGTSYVSCASFFACGSKILLVLSCASFFAPRAKKEAQ